MNSLELLTAYYKTIPGVQMFTNLENPGENSAVAGTAGSGSGNTTAGGVGPSSGGVTLAIPVAGASLAHIIDRYLVLLAIFMLI